MYSSSKQERVHYFKSFCCDYLKLHVMLVFAVLAVAQILITLPATTVILTFHSEIEQEKFQRIHA